MEKSKQTTSNKTCVLPDPMRKEFANLNSALQFAYKLFLLFLLFVFAIFFPPFMRKS